LDGGVSISVALLRGGPAVRILFAPAASPSLAGDAAFVGRDAARSGTLRLPDSCRALDAVVVTTAGLYGDKASVLTAGTTLYKFVFPAAVER